MTAPLLLGLGWAALVVATAWSRRPPPVRVRSLHSGEATIAAPDGHRRALVPGLPAAVADLAGRALRRPVPEELAGRLAVAAAATALCLAVLPLAAPAVGGACLVVAPVRRRRARRRHDAVVRSSLPEVVDLLALAVGAGLTVPLALEAVARRATGPVAEALGQAVGQARAGRRLADALGDVPAAVGEPVRPLVAALLASERYGAPLLERLGRLADEARADARRRAEEAARRVPVALLFPLVLCTLPAFALLTLAPLLAGGLRSLRP